MMAGGLIVMALMMGAMFLLGGHKTGHKHQKPAPQTAVVSNTTVVSTAPVQAPAPPGATTESEHSH